MTPVADGAMVRGMAITDPITLGEDPEGSTYRVLTSGRTVVVDPGGKVLGTLGCPWSVQARNPMFDLPAEAEWYPDFPEDMYVIVPCNAPVRLVDVEMHWDCRAGHHQYGMERESEIGYAEEMMERNGVTSSWPYARPI